MPEEWQPTLYHPHSIYPRPFLDLRASLLRCATVNGVTVMYNTLEQVFGYPQFRAGQEAAISAVLAGRSAAAIFPTGSGKSLCYQLPAL